jgi:hypothetical protein
MHMPLAEIEVLRAIEKSEAEGTTFSNLEEIVEKLSDPALEKDTKRLRQTLESLKKKSFIEFEVGKGIHVTESGCTALRAL